MSILEEASKIVDICDDREARSRIIIAIGQRLVTDIEPLSIDPSLPVGTMQYLAKSKHAVNGNTCWHNDFIYRDRCVIIPWNEIESVSIEQLEQMLTSDSL